MRWSYKTVHFSLKKEGLLGSAFLDEAEIEESLNEFGKNGWELVSFMEVNDGLIAIFKQPFGKHLPSFEESNVEKEAVEAPLKQEVSVTPVQTAVESSSSSTQPDKPVVKSVEKKKREQGDADVGSIRIA